MIFRTGLGYALLVPFLLVLSSAGQSGGNVPADIKDRVCDRLFRLDTASSSFLSMMTLRYGDSDTQLVVLTHPVYPVHPGGRAELISYTITGMGSDNLSQFISKMAAQNPSVTDQEIAAKLKVVVKRSPIGYEALKRFFEDLEAVRISPMSWGRIAVDEYSEYEFWYNGGQESVHYKLVGPFKDDPRDKLVEWMIRFRTGVPDLMSAASANHEFPLRYVSRKWH
jgi:hypothetical protein